MSALETKKPISKAATNLADRKGNPKVLFALQQNQPAKDRKSNGISNEMCPAPVRKSRQKNTWNT
jgi:hypothetical protein